MSFVDVVGAGTAVGSTIHGMRDVGSMGRNELTNHEMIIGVGVVGVGAFFAVRDKSFMPVVYSLMLAAGGYFLFEYMYRKGNKPKGQVGNYA